MIMTRHFQSITRILLATMAFAGLAFVAVGAAGSAQGAGLTNCTEMSTSKPRSGCWEDVWVGGTEHRMVVCDRLGHAVQGQGPR